MKEHVCYSEQIMATACFHGVTEGTGGGRPPDEALGSRDKNKPSKQVEILVFTYNFNNTTYLEFRISWSERILTWIQGSD